MGARTRELRGEKVRLRCDLVSHTQRPLRCWIRTCEPRPAGTLHARVFETARRFASSRADGPHKTDRWGGLLRQSLGELGTRVSASFMRRERQFRMGVHDRVGARMHGQCQLLTKHFGNLLTRYVTCACEWVLPHVCRCSGCLWVPTGEMGFIGGVPNLCRQHRTPRGG